MLRLTFCFFNSLLEQQVVLKDRDTISDSEEASKGLQCLNDRVHTRLFSVPFPFFIFFVFGAVYVLTAGLLGHSNYLRIQPMLMLCEKCKLDRRIFEQGLVHLSFDCFVHLESKCFVRR